ncbi:cell wall-binding repeat-containing protein [Herbiconiux sp. P17]|uniref:cell wall-binding repeat-containing protein n=1 Tax=Herbiconiux wuyangfengii TaxID=3342794 RepID=UPI0035BAAB11
MRIVKRLAQSVIAVLVLSVSIVVVAPQANAWSEEETLFTLINQARAEHGLSDMVRDQKFDYFAWTWSADMRINGFRHSDPGWRQSNLWPGFTKESENISVGSRSPQAVFDSWMSQPEARANILEPSFTNVGIGSSDFPNAYNWTVVFAAYPGQQPIVQPKTPTIGGSNVYTGHLTAYSDPWGPGAVHLAYQWQIDGNDIPGATQADFYPDWYDKNREIRVRVTGTKDGYRSTSRLSAPTSVGLNVTGYRVDGATRYDIAAALSYNGFYYGASTVFIATGENFPDALSAAPVAARVGGPLLLVTRDTIPDAITRELDRLAPTKIVIVGGVESVSPAVEEQLLQRTPAVERISGADRFEVSRALADWGFGAGGARSAFLASGSAFADALSAGAAGKGEMPVILVDGSQSAIDDATRGTLTELGVTSVEIAGGPVSVSPGLEQSLGAGFTTTRLAGADRYTTSIAVNAAHAEQDRSPYLAVGTKFPDALTGSVVAAKYRSPLYVVPPDCVPRAVRESMNSLSGDQFTIIGGENSLSRDIDILVACSW